jgi:predicted regulator of Ras-like GTPase activity (Roadblock/LC7/MglB family)
MSSIQATLKEALTVNGAIVAAVVDANSGLLLGSAGSGLDIELAAAGNTEVVRAKLATMHSLKLDDVIEDILITLGKQYHVIRPIAKSKGIFLYFVLDKNKANLALARHKLQELESQIEI